ncbi:DUF760 domain-containing protein [Synechococcales cyanobacterium C]|uniref:DUF760 domain-containing protein n=1 Tax=Petrachloros mirabilis ULC683 TaxID=2781853 RepID=A0A8K2A8B9_9CYAN|nr:DUF760 domain-containing protein [Petrachloros mirabilis]NCJ06815.1 DUF760 domain-containing protein [Petrachloros mirabilis ULC683]
MDNLINQAENFGRGQAGTRNSLWKYVQSLEPETQARLSQPASEEVLQLMEGHVRSILGGLPSEHFEVTVTTSRENLGRLLASAMLSGYFLRAAEQRMTLENALGGYQAQDGSE